jgi:protein-disulfide isomerase
MKYARILLILLLTSVLGLLAACNLPGNSKTPSNTQIEKVVHDYLTKNPEVVMQALQALQRKQFEKTKKRFDHTRQAAPKFSKELFHAPNDPMAGNPEGTVTLVEFFDYQCPHCMEMLPVTEALVKDNPNLRIVYKEFPIFGANSQLASKAALAAAKQNKYNEVRKALLNAKTRLDHDKIMAIVKSTGVDMAKLKKDMTSPDVKKQLAQNDMLARKLRLIGTPAFFVGKENGATTNIQYAPGLRNKDQLQHMISEVSKATH